MIPARNTRLISLLLTVLAPALWGFLIPGVAQAQVIRGACCFANGTCTTYRSSVCTNRGGTWRGANTSCTPNVCPLPRGACCFTDGGCAWVTRAGCQSRRGTYQGHATTCGVRTCPRPPTPAGGGGGGGGTPVTPAPQIGACCLPDLTCIETTATDCATRNGTFQGLGRPCFRVYCPAASPPASCCFPDGSCVTTTAIDCLGRAGYFRAGIVCSATACVQTGACCIGSGGSCSLETQADCATQNGQYRGNFTSCTNGGCVSGAGACCLRDSSCVMVTAADCTGFPGRFRGVNSACSQQYCVDNATSFACCLQDSTCVLTTLRDCFARRGVWGNGPACVPMLCQVMGSCCISTGQCYSAGMVDCAGTGGSFVTGGSCNIQACPRACPCNWNGDRWVNEGDLFRYIADWMQGRADYDNDGDTDEGDARQFIDCLLHHPSGC